MEPPLKLQRVLYVEDDDDIREVAQLALEHFGGYTVLACASGASALERAAGFAPELIVLDVMMPEMDGPATLKALRAMPEFKATPVVFVTAKVQPNEVAEFMRMGVTDVVAKPFDPVTFAQSLQAIWARARRGRRGS